MTDLAGCLGELLLHQSINKEGFTFRSVWFKEVAL